MNSLLLTITSNSIEAFLLLIQNYGFAMVIAIVALYFVYRFIVKTWKRFNTSEDLKESLLEKTLNGDSINVKYDNRIIELEKKLHEKEIEIKLLKGKNLSSLKSHEVFFTLQHHLKMVYMIDFKDNERNMAFRNILINKLTTIKKYAEYLLTLDKVHNVENIDDLPRAVITTEIYDVIDNIITDYNNKSLEDFKHFFGYDNNENMNISDCLTEKCTIKSNNKICNKNLGSCIFNKIMNDPDKGFNVWHKATVDNITFNLDYYTSDDTISNTEVVRLTLGELSKGGSTTIEHIHKTFETFNGDLTHLFDLYRISKLK